MDHLHNIAVAQTFLSALKNHDWAGMRSLLTDDVLWSMPGDSRISGVAHGADAVVERARLIAGYGLDFGVKHIMAGKQGVAIALNNTAKRGALVLNEHLVTVCLLQFDKIARIDSYLSDVPMANAFFT